MDGEIDQSDYYHYYYHYDHNDDYHHEGNDHRDFLETPAAVQVINFWVEKRRIGTKKRLKDSVKKWKISPNEGPPFLTPLLLFYSGIIKWCVFHAIILRH